MNRWRAGSLGLGVGLVLGLSGCGAAGLTPAQLGVTARDAFVEGRTRAATWDPAARLRWIEGVGISAAGTALPGAGQWRLHYTAAGRQQGLVVVVAPVETGEEERPAASPPGFVIGDRTVPDTWIDSPEALSRILASRGDAVPEQATLLLVPTQPLQWVITFPEDGRQWRLDAETGQVRTP
jgi:hypothetical protein